MKSAAAGADTPIVRSLLFTGIAALGIFFAATQGGIFDPLAVDECNAERLGATSYGPLSTIYQVEGGNLSGICHGQDDPMVYDAWANLTMFTTPEDRESIVGFAGFRNTSNRSVLAYARSLDSDRTRFMIAVNLDMVELEPWGVRRVMAHEYAHVLTRSAPGLDNDECGEFGCVSNTNYMGLWVEQFWNDNELGSLRGNGYDDAYGTNQRCASNAGFPTQYGATNPYEDFSESFTFFLFSHGVAPSVQPRIQFLSSFPELVRMRDRVLTAGFADLRTYQQNCGTS